MRVYRMEHGTLDEGPFQVIGTSELTAAAVEAGVWDWEKGGYHEGADHPTPAEEPKLKGAPYFLHCGCSSLDQLRHWFPDFMAETLDSHGFELTTWEVPEGALHVGDKQVLFDRDEADLLSQEPVAALYA